MFTGVCAGVSGGLGYDISPQLLLPVIVALYELAVRAPEKAARAYCLAVIALIVLTSLLPDQSNQPSAGSPSWSPRSPPPVSGSLSRSTARSGHSRPEWT